MLQKKTAQDELRHKKMSMALATEDTGVEVEIIAIELFYFKYTYSVNELHSSLVTRPIKV